MSRHLELTPYFQRDYIPNVHDAFRLRVEVTDAIGVDGAIFVYLQLPLEPGTAEHRGHFSHIASPVDIETHPVAAPFANADPKWFRLDYIDLLLRSREEALELWDDIQDDVAHLISSYEVGDTILSQTPVWFNSQPPGSSSSESSSSSETSFDSSSSGVSASSSSSDSSESTGSRSDSSSSLSQMSSSSSSSSSDCIVDVIARPYSAGTGTWFGNTYTNVAEEIYAPDKTAEDGNAVSGLGISSATQTYNFAPQGGGGVKRISVHILGLKLDDTDFTPTVNLNVENSNQTPQNVTHPLFAANATIDAPDDYAWDTLVFEGPWTELTQDVKLTLTRPTIGAADAWVVAALYITYHMDCGTEV